MKSLTQKACQLLREGQDFAVTLILHQSGSTPRESGTLMLVEADGTIMGTVGGGRSEAETIVQAVLAIQQRQPKLLHFDMSNDDAAGEGLICGGETDIWVDYVDAQNSAYLELYTAMADLWENGQKAWWGFYPDVAADYRQCLLREDGSVIGAFADAAGTITVGRRQYKSFDVFTFSEHKELYLKRIGTEGKAVIYGGGHVAQQLVSLLSMVGFETVVMDDRESFANASRFPSADRLWVQDLSQGILEVEPCNEDSYCIIVTRGHAFDRDVLAQVLRCNAHYIGMIGSRSKRDAIYDYLLKQGYTQADIDRVHSPIGLDIKAQTPQEIAISIAAELIQVRRRG